MGLSAPIPRLESLAASFVVDHLLDRIFTIINRQVCHRFGLGLVARGVAVVAAPAGACHECADRRDAVVQR
jgi:hypothetical protein